MMVGRESLLGWCLTNGTGLSSGAQVGTGRYLSSVPGGTDGVRRTRSDLSGARSIPCNGHPNLCLPWSARSWISTSGHAKIVGPSSRDLVVHELSWRLAASGCWHGVAWRGTA